MAKFNHLDIGGTKKVPSAFGNVFICSGSATDAKTVVFPDGYLNGTTPEPNLAFKAVFPNGHNAANASSYLSLNGVVVVSNQNGTLAPIPVHAMTEGGSTVYKVLQANTVLELYYTADYDGNNTPAFVVIGNPVVLSSADYTIYANGSFKEGVCGDVKIWFSNTIPYGWLLCNGQSCASYSNLTTFLGKNTVPDLRGEFLRGAGTNSHANQGSGSSVGVHQDATEHVWTESTYVNAYDAYVFRWAKGASQPVYPLNCEHITEFANPMEMAVNQPRSGIVTGNRKSTYTSRPTNTSVNYIIKW